ncbi:predicted protein [Culex quinquefasciatus]|uniref:Predicted protein n=1 Tax=Culex quinquefasciatus TaxID=7176 RepID=B0WQ96_CULQU|nr:predicted protein [Culex quinquefasciatus]|eukprot:XP_001850880.1 predicted protein [Culex quinquefasciatus]
MAEFQGSFLSFINSDPTEKKSVRKPVPEPKLTPAVIDLEEDSDGESEEAEGAVNPEVIQQGEGEEQVIEAGLYEVVEEDNIEDSAVMASVKKVLETREEMFNRLESELEQLTQACQDDFLFQITDEEYDGLFKHKDAYLSELCQQVRRWCCKNLQVYRVCLECGFKAISGKEMRDHLRGSGVCKSHYYALGTCELPVNVMHCRECSYATNFNFNMRRHQQTKGHSGIDKLTEAGQLEAVVEPQQEVEVQVQASEPEAGPAPSCSTGQGDALNEISMWPKDDDSGGLISNLQSRLEQQVENSDDHFIFRISHEEYIALSERRAYHMAKFGELVNIYCNKTLKLYQVCDGCGFATFLRKDMIKHFETGTCILSYFNALGTCDDDDPNKDAVEEDSTQLAPIENQFQITEVETTAIETEPTEIEPAGVDRYLQPKIPRTELIFRCPHCSREMCVRNKPRHLKLHCPVLLGKSATEKHPIPDNHHCPKCTRAFQTIIRLNHHIRTVHNEQTRFQHECGACQRQFKFDHLLVNHQRKGCNGANKTKKPVVVVKKKPAAPPPPPKEKPNVVRGHFSPVPLQCKDCMIFFVSMADLYRHQKSFCKAAPLETVIKVEPTHLGGGLGQG